MPIPVAPATIDLTDFSGGWQPDLEAAGVPANALLEVRNLIPDIGSATPQTRNGFLRFLDDPLIQGYTIQTISPYNRLVGEVISQYLICVLTNELDDDPDNVQLFAIDLLAETFERIDTPGRAWTYGDARHWGETISQTYYGGGRGDPMYSWNPEDGWDDDPSVQDFQTLVASWTSGQNLGTNEVVTVEVTGGPTGGTFRLKYRNKRTDPLNHNATATQVETALEDIYLIGVGNVAVTGGSVNDGTGVQVEFVNLLARRDVDTLKATAKALTGGASPDVVITEDIKGIKKVAPDYAFQNKDKVVWEVDEQAYSVAPVVRSDHSKKRSKKSRDDDRGLKKKGDDKFSKKQRNSILDESDDGPELEDDEGATGGIRFHEWRNGKRYRIGDRVSIFKVWGVDDLGDDVKFWKSFECIRRHTSKPANAPTDSPVDEVQLLKIHADAGTFKLEYVDDTDTSTFATLTDDPKLPYDISVANLQTALDVATGVGNTLVANANTLTAGVTEVQTLRVKAEGGTFKLGFLIPDGPSQRDHLAELLAHLADDPHLPHDISAADLQTALENVVGVGNVEVANGYTGVGTAAVEEVQRLRVDATGGDFRLGWINREIEDADEVFAEFGGSERLAFNISAANLQTALEGVFTGPINPTGAGNVTVTGGPGANGGNAPYVITWLIGGDFEGVNIKELVPHDNRLTGGGKSAIVTTKTQGAAAVEPTVDTDKYVITYSSAGDTVGDYRHMPMHKLNVYDARLTVKDPYDDRHREGSASLERTVRGVADKVAVNHKFSITFQNDLGGQDVATLRVHDNKLSFRDDDNPKTKGEATISTITPGYAGGGRNWKPIRLDDPRDAENEVSPDWDLVASASQTNVGTFHGERLFLRYDDVGESGHSRLQYSAPLKPKHGSDIGELVFDPKNFVIGDDESGDGGGFMDIRTGDGDEISALFSYGNYLIIFKRRSTYVLSGLDENTWTRRLLANVGCIGPRAVCESEGLIYFLSDQGLYATDGTQATEVPGGERIRDWLRDQVNWENEKNDVTLWAFGGYVWISLPADQSGAPNTTIVYDANTESFWPQTLAVQAVGMNRIRGVDQMFFSMPVLMNDDALATTTWDDDTTERTGTSTVTYANLSTAKNLIHDPGFEPKRRNAPVKWYSDYRGLQPTKRTMAWRKTSAPKLKYHLGSWAAYKGKLGSELSNIRKVPTNTQTYDGSDGWFKDTAMDFDGKGENEVMLSSPDYPDPILVDPDDSVRYDGIYQDFPEESTNTHVISAYFRRSTWRKNRRIGYGEVRMFIGEDSRAAALQSPRDASEVVETPDDYVNNINLFGMQSLAKNKHRYRYIGNGWWKVSAEFTGSLTERSHGCLVRPGLTIENDRWLCTEGDLASEPCYWDGDGIDPCPDDGGGTGGRSDAYAVVFQYDHPDVQIVPTDDANTLVATFDPFGWNLRTAWISFGAIHEERRVRRTWALIRGEIPVNLRAYTDWEDDLQYDVEETPNVGEGTVHFEGRMPRDSAASSYSVSVEGIGAPVGFLGVGVMTEPRRIRYHREPEFTNDGDPVGGP